MVPVNPREEDIEGQKCAKSLTDLPEPQEVSVSVVTPPGERRRSTDFSFLLYFFLEKCLR